MMLPESKTSKSCNIYLIMIGTCFKFSSKCIVLSNINGNINSQNADIPLLIYDYNNNIITNNVYLLKRAKW